jgi:RimJ/RimL family protein N-acetyltransferase
MIKLKKYKNRHAIIFLRNLLLDFDALKNAGVFTKKFIWNLFNKKNEQIKNYVILSNEKVVGGLDLVELGAGKFNIGCIVFKRYRNKGIAEESIKCAFKILKKRRNTKKVLGTNLKTNYASIALVKKLGYKKVGENEKELFWEKRLR